ncbi:hypothetical protein BMR1_03g01750 [Babesia microti strain RI]|uniref:Uncharacterized protein n=1 Tax=Babesia microti (strain RI) TaxID=1133968 RepID=A0A0K3AML2_BABMR|nr:hypothetical protein BMR1_03g01750 [Babesia microti strain RI]CTQ40949.1 hypothetical protein BMR1_03g01750 [Babesia microti strain RI]|eukprot:XP_012648960.1 hypothetical protein BMR1_03g01750 [Babesia microti strain RI]
MYLKCLNSTKFGVFSHIAEIIISAGMWIVCAKHSWGTNLRKGFKRKKRFIRYGQQLFRIK